MSRPPHTGGTVVDPAGGTLVCFAVPQEARHFHPGRQSRCRILITGMGQRNAETAIADALRSYSPRLVLTSGYAGGLNPSLKPGDIVFNADPRDTIAGHLLEMGARAGTFHCAPRIAVSAADKSRLREESEADVVEMESGVIRAICRDQGIPAATIRVISDDASTDLPLDFNRLSKADGNISYARLALAIAQSPGAIRRLIRFQRDLDLCSRRLARVLEGLLAKLAQQVP